MTFVHYLAVRFESSPCEFQKIFEAPRTQGQFLNLVKEKQSLITTICQITYFLKQRARILKKNFFYTKVGTFLKRLLVCLEDLIRSNLRNGPYADLLSFKITRRYQAETSFKWYSKWVSKRSLRVWTSWLLCTFWLCDSEQSLRVSKDLWSSKDARSIYEFGQRETVSFFITTTSLVGHFLEQLARIFKKTFFSINSWYISKKIVGVPRRSKQIEFKKWSLSGLA